MVEQQRSQELRAQLKAQDEYKVASGQSWVCFGCQTTNDNSTARCKLCSMPHLSVHMETDMAKQRDDKTTGSSCACAVSMIICPNPYNWDTCT